MKMQVLGVLVSTEIGANTAAAVLRFDLSSYLANDVEQPVNNGYVVTAKIRQRWDMSFRHHDDMNLPVGPRVVKRQHVVRLSHDLDGRSPAQGFVTIEVVRHRFYFPAQRQRSRAVFLNAVACSILLGMFIVSPHQHRRHPETCWLRQKNRSRTNRPGWGSPKPGRVECLRRWLCCAG